MSAIATQRSSHMPPPAREKAGDTRLSLRHLPPQKRVILPEPARQVYARAGPEPSALAARGIRQVTEEVRVGVEHHEVATLFEHRPVRAQAAPERVDSEFFWKASA